jgi:nucleotide-binding universal stress UspA family protein
VLVGYNIILGEAADGTPIRLLSESVLNGTILMILVTCTIASFVAQKGAHNIALAEASDTDAAEAEIEERILIPINNPETTDELINLSVTVKSKKNKTGLYALNVINNDSSSVDSAAEKSAAKLLDRAAVNAAATDDQLHKLLRYDLNIINAITSVVKEHKITDLIMGLHHKAGISDSFLGTLTEGILTKCNTTTLIYKAAQPLATIKRHLIVVPQNAEREIGFPFWLIKVWNLGRNTGAKLVFYGSASSLAYIKSIHAHHPVESGFVEFEDWDDFLILSRDLKSDENLIVVLSRKDRLSYHYNMTKLPYYLNKYFMGNNFILIYPMQIGVEEESSLDYKNIAMLEPLEKLDDIGKTIANLFRKK